jgi:hypothetical protein
LAPLQDILGGKWGYDIAIGNFGTLVIPARFTELVIAIHRTSRMEEEGRKGRRGKERKRTRERNGKQSCLELGISDSLSRISLAKEEDNRNYVIMILSVETQLS